MTGANEESHEKTESVEQRVHTSNYFWHDEMCSFAVGFDPKDPVTDTKH
jgi:hypothetical protein